jgi:hypothetical protein
LAQYSTQFNTSPNERTLRSRVVATGIEISPGDEIRLESSVGKLISPAVPSLPIGIDVSGNCMGKQS